MTDKRRTTIFVDGSAFRDTLRKAYFDKFRRLEETIDYHAFGQFLCAADEQLVRINYYAGEPVEITETLDEATGKLRSMMGRIALGDHEAHRAQRVLDGHRRLVPHIDGCRYTRCSDRLRRGAQALSPLWDGVCPGADGLDRG